MNRIATVLASQPEMNTSYTHSSRTTRQIIGNVRAMIERQFPTLHQEQPRLLQLALNEAEALAWQTGFAHLLFPLLALEKVRSIEAWHARQETIRPTEPILTFAV